MSIYTKPFRNEDFRKLEMRKFEARLFGTPEKFVELLEYNLDEEHTISVWSDDKVIAICGLSEMWRGVADLWLIPSAIMVEHAIAIARLMRHQVETIKTVWGLRRIQMQVRSKSDDTRFAHWLGFKYEGTMAQWGPDGSDFDTWVWLKKKEN